ncbi:MAG: tRNA (guanosine(37)-N1)-methyltransferase TrmD [bacterium]
MQFDVVTLFPELIQNYCSSSIMGRAQKNEVITVNTTNPRDFSKDKHKKVDDTPYGGGAGMVLMCEPFFASIEAIPRKANTVNVLLTPQGEKYSHEKALELSTYEQIVLICGHYEGFDERIRTGIDLIEISLGDFVLTGGEVAALTIIDSVSRLIPGALGKHESACEDSFYDGLLEYPHYTRPYDYRGMCVPDVLLSGNHKEIDKWRRKQSIMRTFEKRPDLIEKLDKSKLSKEDKILLNSLLKD